jgi:hypothetical protein
MTRKQPPLGEEKARLVPVSLYPQTIAQLDEIQRASGESRGAALRRLVEREARRLRRVGIARAPVWTFPGYRASGPRINARVVLRSPSGADDRIYDAEGDRVRPTPPVGSYVVIGDAAAKLRGQVEGSETTEVDGAPTLIIYVRELNPSVVPEIPLAFFDFVLSLNDDVASVARSEVSFDPNRTTPSWKLGQNEVRALLVGEVGQPARTVRFYAFAGPTFQDHLVPVGTHLPLVAIDDEEARSRVATLIVNFLEDGPLDHGGTNAEQTFVRWTETIYILIHDQLGGDPAQSGLSRRFGAASFMCSMDYKPAGDRGIAQLIVQIAAGIARGRRRTERYDWRKTAATTVAYDAVRNYKALLESE